MDGGGSGSHYDIGGSVVIEGESNPNPRLTVAGSLQEVTDVLKESCLENATYKCVLRALKITGAQNAKLRTKAKILPAKMVQRQFSVADALALVDYVEDGREEPPQFWQVYRALP